MLAFILWNSFKLSGQSLDFGLCLAGSNYSGDLTENSRVAISQTRLGIGSSARYELSNVIGIKVQYLFMQIEGADAKSKNEWQIKRNLQFRTAIHNVDLFG